jgi:membrane fusion protein (multidrug efflux system)
MDLLPSNSLTRLKPTLIVARATYNAAKDEYRAAQQQIATSRSQLKVTNTGVSQRQVDIDYAKLQLTYTLVKAPSAGIVSKKNVQVGQLVQAGQTLFSIVNDNSIYVTANFKETQLDQMKNGQKVDIEVDAYPDLKLEGVCIQFLSGYRR